MKLLARAESSRTPGACLALSPGRSLPTDWGSQISEALGSAPGCLFCACCEASQLHIQVLIYRVGMLYFPTRLSFLDESTVLFVLC